MEAQKWNGNDQHVRPCKTLVETLGHANPQFYLVVYVILVTLLTILSQHAMLNVAFFVLMMRLKTPL